MILNMCVPCVIKYQQRNMNSPPTYVITITYHPMIYKVSHVVFAQRSCHRPHHWTAMSWCTQVNVHSPANIAPSHSPQMGTCIVICGPTNSTNSIERIMRAMCPPTRMAVPEVDVPIITTIILISISMASERAPMMTSTTIIAGKFVQSIIRTIAISTTTISIS